MRFSENRPIAYAVLALAIVLALVFGGGGALMDKRNDVDRIYYASSESITAELHEMRDNAVTILSIARKYDTADSAYIAGLESAISELESSGNAAEDYAASTKLDSAIEHVYSDLTGIQMSSMDTEDVRYKYKNFSSAKLRISHDPYHELAADFNDQLSAFPANLLGMLRGVKPLAMYQ